MAASGGVIGDVAPKAAGGELDGRCRKSGTEWCVRVKNIAVTAATPARITTGLVGFIQSRLFFSTPGAQRE
jgi:hypothetical protein